MPEGTQGPYLSLAVLCEKVIEDKAGVLSLIRLIDRVEFLAPADGPEDMPPQQIGVTLVLGWKAGGATGVHRVNLRLENPGGQEQEILSDGPLPFESGQTGANALVDLKFVARQPGTYWINVRLDGQLTTRIPLQVSYRRRSAEPVG